jgi:hypothetical protein
VVNVVGRRNVVASARASGCFQRPAENPHEMALKKGNVKTKRKVGHPQIIEKNGSPHWTISATVDVGLRSVKDDENRREPQCGRGRRDRTNQWSC